MPRRTISIALLVADVPKVLVPTYGDYERIYPTWLGQSKNTVKRHKWQDELELRIKPFDVVHKMEYPEEGQLKDGLWDCIMTTGSASSASADLEWTNKLAGFIRHVAQDHPLVRIVGICYGHQIIARAFGSEVLLNPKGWELGVYDAKLTEEGLEVLDWEDEAIRLQQVHRDVVEQVPPDFEGEEFINLASTDRCLVQGLALKYPTEAPPLPSAAGTSAYTAFDVTDGTLASSGPHPARTLHVLTVQGHPEFSQGIVELIMDDAGEMGVVPPDVYAEGQKRASLQHDGFRFGATILAMLGYESARDEGGPQFS